ncbi:hypothetical protein lerEdw1_011576, partial [Lerista edwardsae]
GPPRCPSETPPGGTTRSLRRSSGRGRSVPEWRTRAEAAQPRSLGGLAPPPQAPPPPPSGRPSEEAPPALEEEEEEEGGWPARKDGGGERHLATVSCRTLPCPGGGCASFRRTSGCAKEASAVVAAVQEKRLHQCWAEQTASP